MQYVFSTDICGSGETLVYDADDQPTTSCEPCPVGQYKDMASFVCKKCLSGFTTSGSGSTECLREFVYAFLPQPIKTQERHYIHRILVFCKTNE